MKESQETRNTEACRTLLIEQSSSSSSKKQRSRRSATSTSKIRGYFFQQNRPLHALWPFFSHFRGTLSQNQRKIPVILPRVAFALDLVRHRWLYPIDFCSRTINEAVIALAFIYLVMMFRNLSKTAGFAHRSKVATSKLQQPQSLSRFLSATQSHSVNTVTGTDTELKANPVRAKLTLEDGSVYEGISFGAEKNVNGEVVFSTGMTGYTESLTDPSYRGQILSLTYPMLGNYGVPSTSDVDKYGLRKGFESSQIHATALLCQDYAYTYSHWDAKMSLSAWLKQEGIPGIHGIDTRLITKKVRSKGAMLGRIEFEGQPGVAFSDPNGRHLVAEVSTKEVKIFGKGRYT